MLNIGVLLLICFVLIYLYQKRKLNYWKRLGIPQIDGLPFVGNLLGIITLQKSIAQHYEEIYEKCKDLKYVGVYQFTEPCLFVKDIGIIENIFVKDFSSFINRGTPEPNTKSETDFGLPQVTNTLWRGLRYKMTPAFSTGRLKVMYENMQGCSLSVVKCIESLPGRNEIDFKDITSRFTMDVIASCVFGLDISKETPANLKFREMGKKTVMTSKIGYFFHCIFFLLPKLAEKLGVMFSTDESGKYFAEIIKDTFKLRLESKQKRNDLIDFLLQLKQQETITILNKDPEDKYLEIENVAPSESFAITDAMLISQAFTFFTAGFEGLATPTVNILHDLAKYKKYQQKCRDEIQTQIDKYKSLSYEALKHATFLDCCINEGLRLYPLTSFLLREATKDYEIEDGIWIKAGTRIIISASGSQKDPNFRQDPLVFNPERANTDFSVTVTDFTNLPFGAGPRMCIGMRMAQLIIKLFLATVILNYDVSLSSKCPTDIEFKTASLVNSPKHKLTFNIMKLK